MTPLVVSARLSSSFVCNHPVAIDALLAAVVAAGRRLPPLSIQDVDEEIEIPLLRHARGFHHGSQAHFTVATDDVRWWTRKLPSIRDVAQLTVSDRLPTAGRYKAFWVPRRLIVPVGATLTWWAVGDASDVSDLLRHVFGVGGSRGSGHGWVARWAVSECGEDRSIYLADGDPARNLPAAMAPPGWQRFELRSTTYPYWRRARAELCAVPESPC